jgi:dihydroorotate dehydrogenase electron transfer subunit
MSCATYNPKRGVYTATVAANEPLCREHYLLRLGLDSFPPCRPGQFIQVQCGDSPAVPAPREIEWSATHPPRPAGDEFTRAEPFLRRPLSLGGRRDLAGGGAELEVIYRVVGTGTARLASLKPGQPVSVLGPLGNGFTVRADKPAAALIAGGVGIPPMIYLAQVLAASGKQVKAFCGVRSEHLLPLKVKGPSEVSPLGEPRLCASEFAAHGVATAIATDDGSLGWKGLVPHVFERWLAGGPLAVVADPSRNLVVYACGPERMMHAVGQLCLGRGIECQLALERHMACGMGTCQSCVMKVRAGADENAWAYKLVCTDGPVFDARDLVW